MLVYLFKSDPLSVFEKRDNGALKIQLSTQVPSFWGGTPNLVTICKSN